MNRDGPDRPAFNLLSEWVADFLYDWADKGENPHKAANRLLDHILRSESRDQAVRELFERGN